MSVRTHREWHQIQSFRGSFSSFFLDFGPKIRVVKSNDFRELISDFSHFHCPMNVPKHIPYSFVIADSHNSIISWDFSLCVWYSRFYPPRKMFIQALTESSLTAASVPLQNIQESSRKICIFCHLSYCFLHKAML